MLIDTIRSRWQWPQVNFGDFSSVLVTALDPISPGEKHIAVTFVSSNGEYSALILAVMEDLVDGEKSALFSFAHDATCDILDSKTLPIDDIEAKKDELAATPVAIGDEQRKKLDIVSDQLYAYFVGRGPFAMNML